MRSACCVPLMVLVTLLVPSFSRAESGASRGYSWGSSRAKSSAGGSFHQVANTTSKSPNVFTKMSSGSKRLMSNTMNIFSSKKPAAKKKRTGTTAIYSTRQKHEEPSFFEKLFNVEPPPPPKTVEEWMSLDQVHP